MYLKIKLLRITVLLLKARSYGDVTPRWLRYLDYYFHWLFFPWIDHVKHRKEDRFIKAANAFESGKFTEKDLLCIVRENQYSAAVLRRSEGFQKRAFFAMVSIQKPTLQMSKFFLRRISWTEIKGDTELEIVVRRCLRVIFNDLKTIQDMVVFYNTYEYNPCFDALSTDFKLKFLSKVRKKYLIDDMITYDRFLSLHVSTKNEIPEIVEKVKLRMMAIVQQDLSKEDCKKLFDRWEYVFTIGSLDEEIIQEFGCDETNYESFLSGDELESFEKAFVKWEFLLYRKMSKLITQWSNEEFNETLPAHEYFRRRESVLPE